MNRSPLVLTFTFVLACFEPKDPVPEPVATQGATTPTASSSAPVAPEPSSSSAIASVPPPVPTLVSVEVPSIRIEESVRLFRAGDHLLVATSKKVGRLTDGAVEWSTGVIGPDSPALGPTTIYWAGGEWPDRLDVLFVYANPRAPVPTYWPLTGKGGNLAFSPGGGAGYVSGVARIGETTLVSGYDMFEGHRTMTVRGPILRRARATVAATCKADEVPPDRYIVTPPAVVPHVFGATAAGTLLSIGTLCEKRGAAAEIWDTEGRSKIVPLKEFSEVGYATEFLPGKGDTAWLFTEGAQLVAFDGTAFTRVTPLPKPAKNAFVSAEGVLFASDGETIHRLDGGAWVPVGHLSWPTRFASIAMHEGSLWITDAGKLRKLAPGDSIEFKEGCTTPFVHLYDVNPQAEPTYTFPTTRKALSTFPDVAQIKLVDFQQGVRRLGVVVPSRAVGEAVMAHVQANMKDEKPKLICYQPTSPREVAIQPKK